MSDSPVPKRTAPGQGATVLVSNRQRSVDVDETGLARLATETLEGEGASGELSLSFVELDQMAELHERFMGEAGPTDVLAFPMGEDDLLGDVVICPVYAATNNPDVTAELRLLVVHGVLHLLGHDHEDEADRRAMWAKQEGYSGVRLS
jgi:probable rRNA maturation factor